mgnify:CR=1 FL=1
MKESKKFFTVAGFIFLFMFFVMGIMRISQIENQHSKKDQTVTTQESTTENQQKETTQTSDQETLVAKANAPKPIKKVQEPEIEYTNIDLSHRVIRSKGQVSVDVDLLRKAYYVFDLGFTLPPGFKIPKIYQPYHKEKLKAERILLNYTVRNQYGTWVKRGSSNFPSRGSGNRYEYKFKLYPKDLRMLRPGKDSLVIEVKTDLVTFWGKGAGLHPFYLLAKVPVTIPQIYQAQVYFHTLKLDPHETINTLMGESSFSQNDMLNSTPDAGIRIYYLGQEVFLKYVRNDHLLVKPGSFIFYYTQDHPYLNLEVIDKDFFPNPSDVLSQAYINVKDLSNNWYRHVPMHCADTLLMFARENGRVN